MKQFPEIRPEDASPEIAAIYVEIRAVSGVPVVNLIWRHFAALPGVLAWAWSAVRPLVGSREMAAARTRIARAVVLPAFVPPGRAAWQEAGVDAAALPGVAATIDAYVRGNTVRFYEWLETSSARKLPAGPPVWICGDCHVGNLGPIASTKGEVDIGIRDLDQTVIGNPAHDLIRLGLSLATAARGSDLPGVTTAHIMEALVDGYELAMDTALKNDESPVSAPDAVKFTMKRALGRKWKQLAEERIEVVRPKVLRGERFWALSKIEQKEIKALFATEAVRRLITQLKSRPDDAKVRVVDAAYWIKGCSSLGRLRY